ncbi:putative globin-like protein [Diaporthe ampelina]|uniref:Putative globin-like protein n=1 Tax=Diaporthe ampelina TaxID=1214573 RepID=A0A0G2HVL1_9PEZI|nr:putative globin-like protein [Diaporthe ampelina]
MSTAKIYDIEALITGSKYIKQLIPAIVNIVYHKLLQYDITARAFETRSTSYEGPVDPSLTENSPQIANSGLLKIMHRKMFLRAYLNKLCSDPSTMEFWYYLDKVGMMHVGRGREHPLHVEYVHIGACLGFIQDTLTEALLSHPRIKMDRKIALVKALNKVIWIQNDLFAKWYVRDGDEFREEMEVHQYEKEGYLDGHKVLDDIEEDRSEGSGSSNGGPRSPATPKTCPFSGIPIRAKGEASPPKAGKQSPEGEETPVA